MRISRRFQAVLPNIRNIIGRWSRPFFKGFLAFAMRLAAVVRTSISSRRRSAALHRRAACVTMIAMRYPKSKSDLRIAQRGEYEFAPARARAMVCLAVALVAITAIRNFVVADEPRQLPAKDRAIVTKLNAVDHASIKICSDGAVQRVDFNWQDTETSEPRLGAQDLAKIRPLLDALPNVKSSTFYFMLADDTTHLKHLAGVKSLEEVAMWACHETTPKVTAEQFEQLASGGKLQRVQIHGFRVKPAIAAIAANEALEELSLYEPIDDTMFAALANAQNLRLLVSRVEGSTITDDGAEKLAALRDLEVLEIRGGKLSLAGITKIASLRNLRELVLTEVGLEDEGMKQLAKLTRLEKLNVSRNPVTDAGADAIAGLPSLHTLNACFTKVYDAKVESLKRQMPSLKQAWSTLGDLADADTVYLLWSKRANLRFEGGHVSSIYLPNDEPKYRPLSNDELLMLKKMESLRTLQVIGSPLDDRAAERIAKWPTLECVWLSGSNITDAGVAKLATLPKLRSVSLNRTAITDAGIAHTAGHRSLERVEVRDTKITDAGFRVLAALPNVTSIDARDTRVTPETIGKFREERRGLYIEHPTR
jgi:hypothetical protein